MKNIRVTYICDSLKEAISKHEMLINNKSNNVTIDNVRYFKRNNRWVLVLPKERI